MTESPLASRAVRRRPVKLGNPEIRAWQNDGVWHIDAVTPLQNVPLRYTLSAERPLVILSGNDLEHFQLAFGAAYAGIPYAPISPTYSLVATDFGKLRDLIDQLPPGAVFVSDGTQFARTLGAVLPPDTELIIGRGEYSTKVATHFNSLLDTHLSDIDEANATVGPIPRLPTAKPCAASIRSR